MSKITRIAEYLKGSLIRKLCGVGDRLTVSGDSSTSMIVIEFERENIIVRGRYEIDVDEVMEDHIEKFAEFLSSIGSTEILAVWYSKRRDKIRSVAENN